MAALRHLPSLPFAILVLVIAAASAVNGANPDAGAARGTEQPSGSELTGGWRLVRTRNPQGGADAVSIMRTADTSRSDLELAGLMVRCGDGGAEVVVALIRAFPLRAKPHVVLGKPGNETQFDATVAPPGNAILLPRDATNLVSSSWRELSDLFIRVDVGETTIHGVVALAGLQAAFKALVAGCAAR